MTGLATRQNQSRNACDGGDDGDEDITLPVVMIRASDGAGLLAASTQGTEESASVWFLHRRLAQDDDEDEAPFEPVTAVLDKTNKSRPQRRKLSETPEEPLDVPVRWCRGCKEEFRAPQCRNGHANFMYSKRKPG